MGKTKRFDDLAAVKTIVSTLEDFDNDMRTRVLRWAREKLDAIDKGAARLERKAKAKAERKRKQATSKKKKTSKKKTSKKKTARRPAKKRTTAPRKS